MPRDLATATSANTTPAMTHTANSPTLHDGVGCCGAFGSPTAMNTPSEADSSAPPISCR